MLQQNYQIWGGCKGGVKRQPLFGGKRHFTSGLRMGSATLVKIFDQLKKRAPKLSHVKLSAHHFMACPTFAPSLTERRESYQRSSSTCVGSIPSDHCSHFRA